MGTSSQEPQLVQSGNPLPPLNPQQKESLLMLIVLNYAEQNSLLNTEQLDDARASLRALFLRATGEETMLRKIIGILKVNRALSKTFSEMAGILEAIRKSHHAVVRKHDALEQQLAGLSILPDENEQFVGPLLEYSGDFVRAVAEFGRQITEYREYMEAEARNGHHFRLAQQARERLKHRFERNGTEDSQQEQRVKQKVFQSFNYAEAESEYRYSQRSAASARAEIEKSLQRFQQLCQMAMMPEMRSPGRIRDDAVLRLVDVYVICQKGMAAFPRLKPLLPAVQDLLRLYQRSFGMFRLDFEKFNNALAPMIENTEDYFSARDHDDDMRTQQRKLDQIEALIAFVEDVAQLLRDGQTYSYPRYSQAVSARITAAGSRWAAIAEPLLHMKVAAEADLTTRLG